MRYLITIYGDPGAMADATPEEMKASMDAWQSVTDEMRDSDVFVAGEGLQPAETATTVTTGAGGGEHTVTDGPFAETKEQLGGFYLLELDDLDQAIDWAKKLPARDSKIEIRPVMVFDEDGTGDSPEPAEASA